MNSLERIHAAIKGEYVDRIPVSMWRHFPDVDHSSRHFVGALIAYQKKFDFDLIKVTPSSGYFGEIFGGNFDFKQNVIKKGVRENRNLVVRSNKEWKKIKDIEINNSILNREIYTIKLLNDELENKVPIFQTVPNAITVARTLRGEGIFEDIKGNSHELKEALGYINGVILDYSLSCLKAGADGIFYFTQLATYDLLSRKEYENFGKKYDENILSELYNDAILIFHIHGLNIMFDLVKDYKIHILNWHDRLTDPSLSDAKKIFSGAVLGGINEDGVLLKGANDEIKRQVSDAIKQTGGRSLIIGPGCVLPMNLPDEKLFTLKEALKI
ncbi:MAG: uroporphyrinogen decarboxylase family protein [Minisyncoccia bacterium]